MNTLTEDAKIISGASWRAWEAKRRLRDASSPARKIQYRAIPVILAR
jgi:hypothetical protein